MELAVPLSDRVEVRRVELGGGDVSPLDEADRLLGGQAERVDDGTHPVGGTRNESPSRAGAFANTSSRESETRGTSSAQAFTSASG